MNPLRILFLVFILATTASLQGIVHVVKKGENLTTISKAYNVSVSELKKVNNIKDANNISIGQKLQIPGTAPVLLNTRYGVERAYPLSLPDTELRPRRSRHSMGYGTSIK